MKIEGVISLKKILDKRNMTGVDWQEYRQSEKNIGGSDCAIILGLNKYKSAFMLWLEKTGQVQPKPVENEYVEWGNLLEPVIREKFKKETGFKVFQNNFVLQHDEHPFMIANIDGEVIDPSFGGERGILEIKTASAHLLKDWEKGCPNHYMLQIQHYLAVTGYNYAYVACLCGGNKFLYYLILRDDYIIDKIISAEMEFMNMVENNITPEISGSSGESDWLADKYGKANDEIVEMWDDLEAWALECEHALAQMKRWQETADTLKNRIKLAAKENKVLAGSIVKINMPTINKVSFDSKAFAADHPDLYERYKTKETSYRSFTISRVK
jgi:putative phage-type endonuclease